MNERIRQLAEQTFYYGNWEGDGIFTGQLDLEKFARLIIKECAGLVDHVIMEDGTRRSDFILKHFGVEE
jgi:hypothetical protein